MKILDLFNEYNLSPEMTWWEMEQPRTEKDRNTMSRIYKAYIVSKDFWWIKWLVDNDKIDIDKYYEFMTNENIDISNACWELDMDKEFYYELLMILAVQDNSIEFLISVLK